MASAARGKPPPGIQGVCLLETLEFPQSKSPECRTTQSSADTFSKRMPRPSRPSQQLPRGALCAPRRPRQKNRDRFLVHDAFKILLNFSFLDMFNIYEIIFHNPLHSVVLSRRFLVPLSPIAIAIAIAIAIPKPIPIPIPTPPRPAEPAAPPSQPGACEPGG